ncbi:serine/threonine protein kinase [Minicystis rosea]|nr:serine/threonine protein kinase [Minicystis rosea]
MPPSARLSGRILGGRYRVGGLLGAGAMGRVYRAEHVDLGRSCAVKVIHRPDDDEDGAESEARFRVEALAAARLDHPNVLRILDFGREPHDGLLYLVTEQLDGVDLADTLATDGPFPLARLARVGRGICAALQHAHDRGVVHRDLKPENVLLVRGTGDDGEAVEEVKILDFGTALIDGEDIGPEDVVLGTPAYMSPEQAAGAVVDGRADIYALGVVLFELATGRLPFDRSTADALAAAHARLAPPRPSAVAPAIDRELESVILACLRKRPRDRPRDARAVRDLLGAALASAAQEEPPATSGTRPVWPMVARVARWAASLAGVIGVPIAWMQLQDRAPPDTADIAARHTAEMTAVVEADTEDVATAPEDARPPRAEPARWQPGRSVRLHDAGSDASAPDLDDHTPTGHR